MRPVDVQRMFDLATSFFLAGERCAPDFKFGPYRLHSVEAPRIVSYAFAVEVALKLILHLKKSKPGRAHNLKALFELVPDESRKLLPYLEDCIDDISSYFVDWRYSYEKELLFGEFDNPRRAFIECYKEIRRLEPRLVSVYKKNWGKFDPDWFYAWPDLEIAQIEARLT